MFLTAVKPILENGGYIVDQVAFDALLQADIALNDGDIDFNVDQHTAYLNNFNEIATDIWQTRHPIPTVPAGIFGGRKASLEEVERGGCDCDSTRPIKYGARIIDFTKSRLNALDPDVALIEATPSDIIENKWNLTINELESAQIHS